MSSDSIPTHKQVYALAAAVRDDELSPQQREEMVTLLHRIDQALRPGATRGGPPYERLLAALWEPGRAGATPRCSPETV